MDKAERERIKREQERVKLEMADALGLGDKVRRVGWGGLTAKETGKIGGYLGQQFIRERESQEQKDVPSRQNGR